ncbi:GCN5-related N-acetyltransferase [Psychrobacter sp. JCM 18901]|uniref:GNAT family N-acetyltransferase n=1 Tax=Psychrobacter sp. JCM 18901 TaxID=1298609 RepID=UPI0004332DE9|nr:GNAT family N-acetyltransferase [Psychrobacter sp. JCM 18901]GAF57227.1 GCN5-related N-acetyltransferase [Psychrobacter sp. JCM 18901]
MLEQVTLSGNGIILEPLTLAYATDLVEACQDGTLWQINETSVPEPDKVVDYINVADSMTDRQAFAVIDERTGKAIGSTSFHDILPTTKRLEIGYTWYAKSYWRTHVNTTCKLMLLTFIFEALQYQTVGWRTDVDNHRSQQAIERLGAKKDGVIRGNRVRRDGVISDTVMYSVVSSEWVDIKPKLVAKVQGIY